MEYTKCSETSFSNLKTCDGSDAPDFSFYKHSDHKDKVEFTNFIDPGGVVHNREWIYNLEKHATIATVGVKYKARVTFGCPEQGCVRTLSLLDDTGFCHGVLELNVIPGAPKCDINTSLGNIKGKTRVFGSHEFSKPGSDSSKLSNNLLTGDLKFKDLSSDLLTGSKNIDSDADNAESDVTLQEYDPDNELEFIIPSTTRSNSTDLGNCIMAQ